MSIQTTIQGQALHKNFSLIMSSINKNGQLINMYLESNTYPFAQRILKVLHRENKRAVAEKLSITELITFTQIHYKAIKCLPFR